MLTFIATNKCLPYHLSRPRTLLGIEYTVTGHMPDEEAIGHMASVIHRAELSKLVADRMGVSQTAAADATAAVLDSIEQALSENDRVTLTGFGTFSVKERAARQMRAIAGKDAGQMIDVPARKYVAVKAGNTLEQIVRDGHQ